MDDENATDQQNPSDHQISLDIERLRVDFTETQALYREVCALLFFRYGITPTANKLYQFVRKGSMSAPTEALRAFWEDLRKKSRVRIEHPDLPESLKKTAGEMVATLWSHAQGAADQGLLELREQATESIKLAQEAQKKAEAENLGMQHVVEQLREEIRVGRERSLQLERDLASERASNEALANQLAAAGQQIKVTESALTEARQDFAAELEKQRQALERAEERLQGTEKRALLEIDHERQVAARLQQEVHQLRQSHHDAVEQHIKETATLQARVADLNQKLGISEGLLQAQKEATAASSGQLEALRSLIGEKETRIALQDRELSLRDARIGELEAELTKKASPRPQAEPRERRKKSPQP
jgi:chromosome segregation ATPase